MQLKKGHAAACRRGRCRVLPDCSSVGWVEEFCLQLPESAWVLMFLARGNAIAKGVSQFSPAGYPAGLLCWAHVCYANACQSDHPSPKGFLNDLAAVLCEFCDASLSCWVASLLADSEPLMNLQTSEGQHGHLTWAREKSL